MLIRCKINPLVPEPPLHQSGLSPLILSKVETQRMLLMQGVRFKIPRSILHMSNWGALGHAKEGWRRSFPLGGGKRDNINKDRKGERPSKESGGCNLRGMGAESRWEQRWPLKQLAFILQQQQEGQRCSKAKSRQEPDLRWRGPSTSPPPGTKGQFECVPHYFNNQRFSFGRHCSHNTNSLSSDINSFFKKKNKKASIITARGSRQWGERGCQCSVKGACVPRQPPSLSFICCPRQSSCFSWVFWRLLSFSCFDRMCRLPADAKQPSSCAWAPLSSLQAAGEKTCLCGFPSIALWIQTPRGLWQEEPARLWIDGVVCSSLQNRPLGSQKRIHSPGLLVWGQIHGQAGGCPSPWRIILARVCTARPSPSTKCFQNCWLLRLTFAVDLLCA